VLSQDEYLDGLSRINREMIGKSEAVDSPQRVAILGWPGRHRLRPLAPLLVIDKQKTCVQCKISVDARDPRAVTATGSNSSAISHGASVCIFKPLPSAPDA